MTRESLINALKEEGVTEVKADGAFDPNFHMAVQTVPADDEHPADHVVQVFQKATKSMIVSFVQQWSLLHNKKQEVTEMSLNYKNR